ncbi:unnamed protein product [Didymodactylos carnosus]|uniref:LamG domain-containing protein n=1 Tax=Didymodactylos carnosus TaxID=1234261 RepID=A0A814QH82_9BILA|nr:unnamed protein product [Didymodactylos carnosus]CAF1119455.1 unnamed protein product [Didymodactylos carnosus]CAF3701885.1 unnamed protein product [Didymodactylos carnosus]CAF3883117.1 unnamed protein product [Didymodactylos carnosus]
MGWCIPFIGFSASGAIVAQVYDHTLSVVFVNGPVLAINIWSHIVETFSPTNGLQLYINGYLYISTTVSTYSASLAQNYITTGLISGSLTCASGNIVQGQYLGAVDEFRLYSRELTSTDVCSLANP